MPGTIFNVLFVCRHNSARSQMAEALLNAAGGGCFHAWSAGTEPAADLHPLTVDTLRKAALPWRDLHPKGLEAFTKPPVPEMDFVFTVCGELAPRLAALLPGRPLVAHWPVPDPALVAGTPVERAAAFSEAFKMLRRRVELLVALPVAGLDRLTLQRRLNAIGTSA